jgi:hypothetical protein
MSTESYAAVDLAAIKRMLKEDGDLELLEQFDRFAGVSVVLIAAATLNPGVLAALGPKNELVKVGQRLVARFAGSKANGSLDRYRRLSAAHHLLVLSAFFEAAQDVIARFDPKMFLIGEEQERITARGVETALDNDGATELALFGDAASLPHPVESLLAREQILRSRYRHMAGALAELVTGLSGWNELDKQAQNEFMTAVQHLPEMAATTYRAQYIELAGTVPEFMASIAVSAQEAHLQRLDGIADDVVRQLEETRTLGTQLDLGFQRLAEQAAAVATGERAEPARVVIDGLRKSYEAAIDEPILSDRSGADDNAPALVYPSKADAFVPQSYKVVRAPDADAGGRLEDEERWRASEERQDLAAFLLGYLSSPYSIQTPLLVLGHPGSGKSLLTQMLAARLATPAFNGVRIELRDIDVERELQTLIEEQVLHDTGRRVDWADLADQMVDAPPVIILDGFDELLQASGRVHAAFLEKVHEFQRREAIQGRPVRMIVTSRITLIDKAIIPPSCTVLRLMAFDERRQTSWIETWNAHNARYFANADTKPFALPMQEAVLDLAGQPLLLLMLALYDSQDNALHLRTDLDRTRLYDDLLRRFIGRERSKGAGGDAFRGLEPARRAREVEADMQRLRTVAIGMYNRRSLHILGDQLDEDLAHLDIAPAVVSDGGSPLSHAEQVLGSFFFVHQSRSGAGAGTVSGRAGATAFEFLHNTFGEFLTADFLLTAILPEVASVATMREQPALHGQCDLKLEQGMLPRAWFTGLAQAPLSERPEILAMVREWTQHLLVSQALAPRRFTDALKELVDSQLHAVLDRRVPPPWATSDDSPYETPSLLGRFAVYTLNLVLLSAAAGDAVRTTVRFDQSTWRRLTFLWRSEWSLESLSALPSIITVIEDETEVALHVNPRIGVGGSGSGIERLWHTANVLGDRHLRLLAGLQVYDSGANDLELEDLDQDLAVHELGLGLSLLLRRIRDQGWTLDPVDRNALTNHIQDAGLHVTSRSHRDLLVLLAQPNAPRILRDILIDGGLSASVEQASLLLVSPEPYAIAYLGVAEMSPLFVSTLASRIATESAWAMLDDRPYLSGQIVRVLHRIPALVRETGLPLPSPATHPEILAALLPYRHRDLRPELGEAALSALLDGDPHATLSRLSSAGLRDVIAATDASPRDSKLRQWLSKVEVSARELPDIPTDSWYDLCRLRLEVGDMPGMAVEDPAGIVVGTSDERELAAAVRLVDVAMNGRSGIDRKPVSERIVTFGPTFTMPTETIGQLPLSAAVAALRLGDGVLGDASARELKRLVARIRSTPR